MPTTTNSKLPYPATTDPADVPGDLQKLATALDEIAYAQTTTSVTLNATAEASANTIVTAPAVTFDGATVVLVEFFTPYISSPTTLGSSTSLWLFQDGASIGALGGIVTPAAAMMAFAHFCVRRLTPTSGSHTYSVRGSVSAGSANAVGGAGTAGTQVPIYIRIRRA